jgi:hypothetical protein
MLSVERFRTNRQEGSRPRDPLCLGRGVSLAGLIRPIATTTAREDACPPQR